MFKFQFQFSLNSFYFPPFLLLLFFFFLFFFSVFFSVLLLSCSSFCLGKKVGVKNLLLCCCCCCFYLSFCLLCQKMPLTDQFRIVSSRLLARQLHLAPDVGCRTAGPPASLSLPARGLHACTQPESETARISATGVPDSEDMAFSTPC